MNPKDIVIKNERFIVCTHLHSESFPRSSLSICYNAHVKSIQARYYQWLNFIKNLVQNKIDFKILVCILLRYTTPDFLHSPE